MDIHDFELYRGDTHAFEVQVFTHEDAPFDVSTARMDMVLRGDNGEETRPVLTVTGHKVRIEFPAESTRHLRWRQGRYDLQMTSGDEVLTALRGKVRLIEDITP